MALYLVPPDLYPGVYRQGVGMFKPGETLTLPDAASKEGDVPSRHLVPLDAEAEAALKKAHGAKAKSIPEDVKAALESAKPKDDGAKPMTVAQAAKASGRAADSK